MRSESTASQKWPKKRQTLSAKQVEIMEDWENRFLRQMPERHRRISQFNHRYPLQSLNISSGRTLEIGAGSGTHIGYELSHSSEYWALELRESLAADIATEYPSVRVVIGDCQERFEFPDDHFDRVIAIHVLEHLDDLPRTLDETARVLRPTGVFSVVIPCEGGSLYKTGRRFTTKREFENLYDVPYEWMIEYDHVNTAKDVIQELSRKFRLRSRTFFPTRVPSIHTNLLIGLTLTIA